MVYLCPSTRSSGLKCCETVKVPKVFHCSKCNGQHKRPVGTKCQIMEQSTSSTSATFSDQSKDENSQILNALNAVSSRLSAIEQRIDRTEEQLQVQSAVTTSSPLNVSSTPSQDGDEDSDAGDDAVIPTVKYLKSSKHIQEAVDLRLQELTKINEQGKFKSQRANNDNITVKQQIPWPQNHVLAGTSKARITYEKSTKVKNAMLDYMSDLMEDAQDFGWASAKGAHALILCRMEEGKLDWLNSDKLDRLRRAHAQKVLTNNPSTGQNIKTKNESQGVMCKYFQSGKCSHKTDHTTNGQLYKHWCSHCYSLGKKFSHAL